MAAEDERQLGVERLLFLRSLSPTRPNGPEAVQMAGAMRDLHFRSGQQLFAIGDPSHDVFFVVKGTVRMTAPGSAPWDFEAPAVIGALDAFASRPRTRAGVATSDTHALALAHTDWLSVMEEHFDFARESLMRISSGLSRMRLGLEGDGGFPEPAPAPGTLAPGLSLFEKTVALRKLLIFRAAGVQATLRLAALASTHPLAPGDVLYREGDPCETLDAVLGGVVAIERADPPIRAAFGPGALVGGSAAIGTPEAPYTARAREASLLLRLRKDDVLDVMEDHFALTRSIMSSVNAERSELMARHGTLDGGGPRSQAAPSSGVVRR
jgi:CRP-like cAMP-binding protein